MRALILGVVLLAAGGSRAAEPAPPPALTAALAAAAMAGKPLVIELWGPACGPCVRLDREVFPDARVQAALRRVHLVRLDGSQGPGELVHDYVLARGWPTFVRFDGAGRVVHTLYGFVPADRLALWLDAVAAQRPYADAVRDELRRSPRRAALHLTLARLLRDEGRIPEALAAYRAAERLDPADRDAVGAEAALERSLIDLSVKHKPERLRAVDEWLARFP
ncbi:MAG TPA: thioredoxin family protein, partial [Polyangia bacterium]